MSSSPAPLNFICRRTDLDHILEGQFIRNVLLAGLERPVRVLPFEADQPWPIMEDSLLLVLGLGDAYEKHLIEGRAKGLRNVGVFHMADEKGLVDCGFYRHASYVLRNYYFAHRVAGGGTDQPPVIWVPNGYANGVGPAAPEHLPAFADRPQVMFFSGHMPENPADFPERKALFDVVNAHGLPSVMAATPSFGAGFGRVSYAAHLAVSKFALAPAGVSPETIRLYDALENGAIPIVLEAEFLRAADALNSPPLVILKSWKELPDFIAPFRNADKALIEEWEERRQATAEWWLDFKQRIGGKVASVIESAFSRAGGGIN